jgi:hypothetical protein
MTDKDEKKIETPKNNLCSNCAWRATCNKRFSVNTANGQVICQDHAFDLALLKKQEPLPGKED